MPNSCHFLITLIMDALSVLNDMAANILPPTNISSSEAERWRLLFNLRTFSDAESAIESHRTDLTRTRVGDELWQTLQHTLEPVERDGKMVYWDKEAYEFYLGMQRSGVSQTANEDRGEGRNSSGTWLITLTWPLDDVAVVERLLERKVKVRNATSVEREQREDMFVEVDGGERRLLQQWARTEGRGKELVCVKINKAKKELSSVSRAPFLGIDASLPQWRLNEREALWPKQDDYPVFYFFYGTLMEEEVLKKHLALQHVDTLRYASYARVRRGKLNSWAGKYKALVDGEPQDMVEGTAFLMQDEEQEDAVRVFETEAYEVVRCEIEMQCGVKVAGLTFRFAGDASQLQLQ